MTINDFKTMMILMIILMRNTKLNVKIQTRRKIRKTEGTRRTVQHVDMREKNCALFLIDLMMRRNLSK